MAAANPVNRDYTTHQLSQVNINAGVDNSAEHSPVSAAGHSYCHQNGEPDIEFCAFNSTQTVYQTKQYTLIPISEEEQSSLKAKVGETGETKIDGMDKLDIKPVTKPKIINADTNLMIPIITLRLAHPLAEQELKTAVQALKERGFGDTALTIQAITEHYHKTEFSILDICVIQYLLKPNNFDNDIIDLLQLLVKSSSLTRDKVTAGGLTSEAKIMGDLFSKYSISSILQRLENMLEKIQGDNVFIVSELLSPCEATILAMSKAENSNYFGEVQTKALVEHNKDLMTKDFTDEQLRQEQEKVNELNASRVSTMVLISSLKQLKTHFNWGLTKSHKTNETGLFDVVFDEDKISLEGNVNSFFCLIPLRGLEGGENASDVQSSENMNCEYLYDGSKPILDGSTKKVIPFSIGLNNNCSQMKSNDWSGLDEVGSIEDKVRFIDGLSCNSCKSLLVAVDYRYRKVFVNRDIKHFFVFHFLPGNVDFCHYCFTTYSSTWQEHAVALREQEEIERRQRSARQSEEVSTIPPCAVSEPRFLPDGDVTGELQYREGNDEARFQQQYDTEAGSIQNEIRVIAVPNIPH